MSFHTLLPIIVVTLKIHPIGENSKIFMEMNVVENNDLKDLIQLPAILT
jgi:hypothetical protein